MRKHDSRCICKSKQKGISEQDLALDSSVYTIVGMSSKYTEAGCSLRQLFCFSLNKNEAKPFVRKKELSLSSCLGMLSLCPLTNTHTHTQKEN
jgi:hypothetical protein